jgi:hypothetical protein
VFNYLPDRYHDYDSAGMNTEEVNGDNDKVDNVDGDSRDVNEEQYGEE